MKAGIIGANGYGGAELIRILTHHPLIQIEKIVSHSTRGRNILELYPHLHGIMDQTLEELDAGELAELDLLFFATPAGVTKEILPQFLEQGVTCIDLSGDFRLKNTKNYEEWYRKSPAEQKYVEQSVYGLTEIYRDQIKEAKFIANPGCFPTAALLGLIPAFQGKLINPKTVHIDAKTGVSGAGRKASMANLFTEVNENVKAYKVTEHQHIPEIEQALGEFTDEPAPISFITHLIPMTRGIMCTMYAELEKDVTTEDVRDFYLETYEKAPFIRIRPAGQVPMTKEVLGTNFCDIGVKVDKRSNRLIIISVIENLVKGAAGQAVQNMNVMFGWDEDTGLKHLPLYP
mgnify:CR=1 FL=1